MRLTTGSHSVRAAARGEVTRGLGALPNPTHKLRPGLATTGRLIVIVDRSIHPFEPQCPHL